MPYYPFTSEDESELDTEILAEERDPKHDDLNVNWDSGMEIGDNRTVYTGTYQGDEGHFLPVGENGGGVFRPFDDHWSHTEFGSDTDVAYNPADTTNLDVPAAEVASRLFQGW